MLFLIIGGILLVAITVLLFMKQPKLTSKKTIIENIFSANDMLFTLRQDIRSVVSENLSPYQHHDQNALQPRYTTIEDRTKEIERKVSTAENELSAYRPLKAHAKFYEIASAALSALQQALLKLDGLYGDSVLLEPVIADIQTLGAMTQEPVMAMYLADDANESAGSVTNQVNLIVAHTDRMLGQLRDTQPQTHEYGNIYRAVTPTLEQVHDDYEKLHKLLLAQQYDAYRSASQALPDCLGRFNTSSYEAIATNHFSDTSSVERFINDLRPYLYE